MVGLEALNASQCTCKEARIEPIALVRKQYAPGRNGAHKGRIVGPHGGVIVMGRRQIAKTCGDLAQSRGAVVLDGSSEERLRRRRE